MKAASIRRNLRFTLPLLLLVLCLTLNSCFFLVPAPAGPTPVDPSDLGTPQTFEKAGITLHLTNKFKEEQSERGFDAYYTTDYCGVVVLKEPFTLEAGLAERPIEQYIKNVIENNGHENIEPRNADGLWYYVNYNNSSYRCVYSYAYKGSDAFYVVQYIINTRDEETLKPIIHDWAKETSVK